MHRTAYGLLLLATIFWGGNVVAGKIAVGHVSPMLLTTLRWGGALSILLIVGGRYLHADRAALRRNFLYLSAMGGLGMGAFNVLMYSSLAYTTAINVSILQAAVPMVVFAANFALFGVRLGVAQFVGFLLTVIGVLLIAGQGTFDRLASLDINIGDGMMLLAVFLYGGYIVGLRGLPRLHWQSMMIAMFAGATVVAAAFTIFEFASGNGRLPDRVGWTAAAYAMIFPSIISQTLLVRGNQIIGSNRTGLFMNLVPVFGTLLSILILSERFQLYHAGALLLVMGGIALAERFRPASGS